jgi:LmbE family N-acetylglucosaminyl deacetylase
VRKTAVGAAVLMSACAIGRPPVGEPLVAATDLVIVAHPDDDLLFMQPDLTEAVAAGTGVTTVYVTAGDARQGVSYALRRERALMVAYAGWVDADWHCGWIEIAGHAAKHCRLDAAKLSLVFLDYPDGGIEGENPDSLLNLWEGNIESASTVAEVVGRYDRAGLLQTAAAIVAATRPKVIRTLEISGTHGGDHSDHVISGAIALLAEASAGSTAELISYRGYNTRREPANLAGDLYAASFDMFSHYEACTGCGRCGETCDAAHTESDYLTYSARRYAQGFRRAVSGVMRSAGQCLDVTNVGGITLGNCDAAPRWTLDAQGALRDPTGHCLAVGALGELAYGECGGGSAQRFFVDDEGHVWSSVAPVASPHMPLADLACLTPGPGTVVLGLCGSRSAPTWDFVPVAVETPRTTLGIAATGRAVRIGDIDGDGLSDLCAIEAGALVCAHGDGTGGFTAATTIASGLPIDPQSLTLGDVDGDAYVDACGLATDGTGILCAMSMNGFAVQAWTSMFGTSGSSFGVPGTAASLAAIPVAPHADTAVCGLSAIGLSCADRIHSGTTVLTTWPRDSAVVWPADLDGNHAGGWCAATPNGPVCAPSGERLLTRQDGVAWGFSFEGVPDPSPQDADTGALADVDGDGRADLCGLDLGNARVACARSQGRGFGPRTTLFAWPANITPTALWLGDLNGDGKADACVDAGATIVCAISP